MQDQLWIEVSKSAFRHNLDIINRAVGKNTLVCPVVKANAYGHGLVETAKIIVKAGADWLAVNSLEEARTLRQSQITLPLLVVGAVVPSEYEELSVLDARFFVSDIPSAEKVAKIGKKLHKDIVVHFKIDTGMGRQGALPVDAIEIAQKLSKMENIRVEGIATHFADSSNLRDESYFKRQFFAFNDLITIIRPYFDHQIIVHAANSGATLLHFESHFDMVRPGIIVYGSFGSLDTRKFMIKRGIELKCALTLKARVVQVKALPKDSYIGYDRTFRTRHDTKIAILPVGYYDGLSRKLSNTGRVLLNGHSCPIIGKICMDMTMVDVSRVTDVKIGDEAVLIGTDGQDVILPEEVAGYSDYNAHEVVTRLRESIKRVYIS